MDDDDDGATNTNRMTSMHQERRHWIYGKKKKDAVSGP